MKRTELACYGLLTAAFVLTGMLIVQLHDHGGFDSPAQAEMALSRGNLTVMTARTKNEEEALFVLENVSQRLLIFTIDLPKKRLVLATEPIALSRVFGTASGGTGSQPTRRSRRSR